MEEEPLLTGAAVPERLGDCRIIHGKRSRHRRTMDSGPGSSRDRLPAGTTNTVVGHYSAASGSGWRCVSSAIVTHSLQEPS